MKIRRFGAAAAAIGVGALVLSGCTAPEADSGLDEGTSVTVAWNQAFYSYNGNTSFGNATANNNIISMALSEFNYYDNTPELVQDESFGSYELVSEDPQTVKYTLAEGVEWSDGTPIDAADLLLAWAANSNAFNDADFDPSEFQDPETGELNDSFPADQVFFDAGGTSLDLVTETPEISDDNRSITLVYDQPAIDWEVLLPEPLPAHVVGKNALGLDDNQEAKDAVVAAIQDKDTAAMAPISSTWNSIFNFQSMPDDPELVLSSGPYVITDFEADQFITLKANENYKGDLKPNIEEVTVRFIGDPLAAVDALENGEVDVISPQATTDVVAGLEAIDDIDILTGIEGTYEHIDLQFDQSKSGHFNNPLVREAFMKTIPRQEIVDTLIAPIIGDDAATRDSQLFVEGTPGYDESAAENGSDAYAEVDIEGATALLAEAGVVSPEVCILYAADNPRRVNEFALIQESANQAGFNVTDCGNVDWGGLLGTPGAYDASLFGWQTTSTFPTNASPNYRTGGINNLNFYSNPKVDELLAELDFTFDEDRQIEIQKEIDTILWTEDFYGVTVFQFPSVTGVSSRVEGVDPGPIAPTIFWNITDWTLAE